MLAQQMWMLGTSLITFLILVSAEGRADRSCGQPLELNGPSPSVISSKPRQDNSGSAFDIDLTAAIRIPRNQQETYEISRDARVWNQHLQPLVSIQQSNHPLYYNVDVRTPMGIKKMLFEKTQDLADENFISMKAGSNSKLESIICIKVTKDPKLGNSILTLNVQLRLSFVAKATKGLIVEKMTEAISKALTKISSEVTVKQVSAPNKAPNGGGI